MGKTYRKHGNGIARSTSYRQNKSRKFAKKKYKTSHHSNRNKNKDITTETIFIPFNCKQKLHKHDRGSIAFYENLINIPNWREYEFSDKEIRKIYDAYINDSPYDNYKSWINDNLENNLKKIKSDIENINDNKMREESGHKTAYGLISHKNLQLVYVNLSLKQLNRRNKVSRFKGHNRKNKHLSKLGKLKFD